MMRSYFIFSYCCFLLICLSCTDRQPPLRIATAANMQYVMPELLTLFTQQTGISCEPIYASSGKLTAQIQAGAPYDVFVSADLKYPQTLAQNGLTTTNPTIYAHGNLVLWTTSISDTFSLNSLAQFKHIALPNPNTAPYGRAGKEVLQQSGWWTSLQPKLVFGESVAQTNQFISTGAAAVGFTAKSVVLAPHLRGKGQWIDTDSQLYQPIQQSVCVIKNSKQVAQAEQFQTFLQSAAAAEILHTFGYDFPTPATDE